MVFCYADVVVVYGVLGVLEVSVILWVLGVSEILGVLGILVILRVFWVFWGNRGEDSWIYFQKAWGFRLLIILVIFLGVFQEIFDYFLLVKLEMVVRGFQKLAFQDLGFV
jgi:hypothetical protein